MNLGTPAWSTELEILVLSWRRQEGSLVIVWIHERRRPTEDAKPKPRLGNSHLWSWQWDEFSLKHMAVSGRDGYWYRTFFSSEEGKRNHWCIIGNYGIHYRVKTGTKRKCVLWVRMFSLQIEKPNQKGIQNKENLYVPVTKIPKGGWAWILSLGFLLGELFF